MGEPDCKIAHIIQSTRISWVDCENNQKYKYMKNKQLIIIAGVTGSMGQELLRHYLVDDNVLVYGISRKGVPLKSLAILPSHNIIVNVNLCSDQDIQKFVGMVPNESFEEVIYYHLIGEFKTEINEKLQITIEDDYDGDGINDDVYRLVAGAYKTMICELNKKVVQSNCVLRVVSFGSLADKHNIPCFHSFGKAREIVTSFSKKIYDLNKNTHFYLFDTSTILAADEMLERPFIFATEVNPAYWITPYELVKKALGYMSIENGFVQKDIYLSNPHFSPNYFDPGVTYKRRVKELYNKMI